MQSDSGDDIASPSWAFSERQAGQEGQHHSGSEDADQREALAEALVESQAHPQVRCLGALRCMMNDFRFKKQGCQQACSKFMSWKD